MPDRKVISSFKAANYICNRVPVKSDLTGNGNLIKRALIIKHGEHSELCRGDVMLLAFLKKHSDMNLMKSANQKSRSSP